MPFVVLFALQHYQILDWLQLSRQFLNRTAEKRPVVDEATSPESRKSPDTLLRPEHEKYFEIEELSNSWTRCLFHYKSYFIFSEFSRQVG
ncbi:MAG: hypothetical protein FJ267_15415 [Planctomycetes bacterium]|nr:hypothetical protein [Planctomycetota bacterium]